LAAGYRTLKVNTQISQEIESGKRPDQADHVFLTLEFAKQRHGDDEDGHR